MKTAVGVILAAVLAAGAGVLGAVVTANIAIASVDKAASNADNADLDAPADYGTR
jgi:hypothetical protein